jgi:hypothetical protein
MVPQERPGPVKGSELHKKLCIHAQISGRLPDMHGPMRAWQAKQASRESCAREGGGLDFLESETGPSR